MFIFPTNFRREYGPLIVQAFRDISRDVYIEGSFNDIICLWVRATTDLVSNAIAEHFNSTGRITVRALRNWLEPLKLWGFWIIATGAGVYLGWSLNLIVRPLLVLGKIDKVWPLDDLMTVYYNVDLTVFILLSVLSGLITGALVGLFQWLVLRRRLGGLGMWIPATVVGFGIDYLLKAVYFLLRYSETSGFQERVPQGSFLPFIFIATPILGALFIGVSQWLVLRREVPSSGWWVLIMPVGTIIALIFHGAVHIPYEELNSWIMRLTIKTSIGVIPLTKVVYPLPYLVEGIVLGAVTGVVIVMLIRASEKQSRPLVVDNLDPDFSEV
jgi:hypothetical protein